MRSKKTDRNNSNITQEGERARRGSVAPVVDVDAHVQGMMASGNIFHAWDLFALANRHELWKTRTGWRTYSVLVCIRSKPCKKVPAGYVDMCTYLDVTPDARGLYAKFMQLNGLLTRNIEKSLGLLPTAFSLTHCGPYRFSKPPIARAATGVYVGVRISKMDADGRPAPQAYSDTGEDGRDDQDLVKDLAMRYYFRNRGFLSSTKVASTARFLERPRSMKNSQSFQRLCRTVEDAKRYEQRVESKRAALASARRQQRQQQERKRQRRSSTKDADDDDDGHGRDTDGESGGEDDDEEEEEEEEEVAVEDDRDPHKYFMIAMSVVLPPHAQMTAGELGWTRNSIDNNEIENRCHSEIVTTAEATAHLGRIFDTARANLFPCRLSTECVRKSSPLFVPRIRDYLTRLVKHDEEKRERDKHHPPSTPVIIPPENLHRHRQIARGMTRAQRRLRSAVAPPPLPPPPIPWNISFFEDETQFDPTTTLSSFQTNQRIYADIVPPASHRPASEYAYGGNDDDDEDTTSI